MKVSELKTLLENRGKTRDHDDIEVVVSISSPSIGPRASCSITSAGFGFDWEAGLFLITPKLPLVVKSEKEEVWDLAFDHIYTLSKQVSYKGNPTSEAKWAQEVMRRAKERTTKEQAGDDK